MSKANVGANANLGAGVIGGGNNLETAKVPFIQADFQCVRPDGRGGVMEVWRDSYTNSVQIGGKIDLLNYYFGRQAIPNASNTWYLGLHSAVTNVSTIASVSGVTASEVGGYATSRFSFSLASTYTTNSASATASYGFTAAGPLTISGAFMAGNNTSASATANTAGVLYSVGGFAAARTVVSNDSLNVTLTLSMA